MSYQRKVTPIENFDFSKVTFEEPTLNGGGQGYSSRVNKSNGGLFIQTPKIYCPFGVNIYVPDNGSPKYSLSISLRDTDSDTKVKQFDEFCKKLDEHIVNYTLENDKWLDQLNVGKAKTKGKAALEAVVDGFYTTVVKQSRSKDGKQYPATINFKLPQYRDGNFSTTLFNKKGKMIGPLTEDTIKDQIPPQCYVRLVFQVQKIWFSGGTKYGVTLNATQLKVYPVKKETGCMMVHSDDEESEVEEDENYVVTDDEDETKEEEEDDEDVEEVETDDDDE